MKCFPFKYYAAIIFLLTFSCLTWADDSRLVDISLVDSTIIVDLPYASSDNFLGHAVYPCRNCCYLRPITAHRLARVQKRLTKDGYGLKIWDGYRPHSVQYKMWEILPDPAFVANPEKGSRHNRGAAVDVTLVYANGSEVPMPTGFDDFSEIAGAFYTQLPDSIIANRTRLQQAMTAEGFQTIKSEWWHFDDPDWQNFEILDVPVMEITNQ